MTLHRATVVRLVPVPEAAGDKPPPYRTLHRATAVRLALMLLVAWLLASTPVRAQALDVDGYRALLREAAASLQAARQAGTEDQARAAANVAMRLRSVTAVQAEEQLIRPRNDALVGALEQEPPNLAAALDALDALIRALDAANPPEQAQPRLQHLREVLARPEFQAGAGLGGLDPLLGPFVTAARRFAYDLLASIGRALFEQGQLGLTVVAGIAVGVMAAATVFVLRSLRGALVAEVGREAGAEAERGVRSHRLWAEGQDLAAKGQARAAVHAFFLSAALHLDELSLLRFDPSQTNHELLVRIGGHEARRRMEPLVASFDELWYGHAACGDVEVGRIRALALQVRGVTA